MTAHDRYLAGYSHSQVEITCRDCEHTFYGTETAEYGTAWLEPEECSACGSTELDAAALSDYDIQELRAEARGEDF